MVLAYYVTILILSAICCGIYYIIKRKYYSVVYTLVFLLAFLSQFCYVMMCYASDAGEALIIYKFCYIGGCYLPLVGFFLILSICKIEFPKWAKFIMIMFATIVYGCSLTAGYSPLFYKSYDVENINGVTVFIKEYGPLHYLFLAEIALLFIATLFALVYGWFKKPDASRRNLAIAVFLQLFSIFAYLFGRTITKEIEWMALADLVDEIGFLIIMNRVGLYRVDDLVSSSIVKEGKSGYISLDYNRRYLSATDVAKRFLPELANNRADMIITDDKLREMFNKWIDEFNKENLSIKHVYRRGEFIYLIHVGDLYDGTTKRGYLIEILDDTEHQQHREGIERYNQSLNRELIAKTNLIKELRGEMRNDK